MIALVLAAAISGVTIDVQSWAEADLGIASRVTYGGRVRATGPLALGSSSVADVYAQVDVTSLPGKKFDVADVETWGRYASATLGAQRRVGTIVTGDQEIYTALEARWSFMTALDKTSEPAARYPRVLAAGVAIGERSSDSRIFVGYGDHDAAGPDVGFFLWSGEFVLDGQVPVTGTAGLCYFGGSAFLSTRRGPQSRDGLELHVAVSPSRLLSRLSR